MPGPETANANDYAPDAVRGQRDGVRPWDGTSAPAQPLARNRRVCDCQERGAGCVDSQRARPEADQVKTVRSEERELEIVPATLRADGKEHASTPTVVKCRAN